MSTSNLIYFIRYFTHIHRSRFIGERSKTKLPTLASTTCKQPTNIVNKSRVLRTTIYLLNIWSIVAFKINQSGTENDRHTSGPIVSTTALSVIIVAPTIDITTSAENHRMNISTFDTHRSFFK